MNREHFLDKVSSIIFVFDLLGGFWVSRPCVVDPNPHISLNNPVGPSGGKWNISPCCEPLILPPDSLRQTGISPVLEAQIVLSNVGRDNGHFPCPEPNNAVSNPIKASALRRARNPTLQIIPLNCQRNMDSMSPFWTQVENFEYFSPEIFEHSPLFWAQVEASNMCLNNFEKKTGSTALNPNEIITDKNAQRFPCSEPQIVFNSSPEILWQKPTASSKSGNIDDFSQEVIGQIGKHLF